MASKKLFVAVPVYGAIEPNFGQCLLHLVTNRPCEMGLKLQIGDSLVARARNALAAAFLKGDCTDLLFIDSDLIFSPEHVKRILDHDEDVVGGFYVKKKQGNPELVCNTFETIEPPTERGLQRVKYMGTGFLKISRRAFERIIEKFGTEISYHPDEQPADVVEYDFFSVGRYKFPDGAVRYLSEDWYFCQRWMDCGPDCKVWADTQICCKHVGPVTFPLESQEEKIFGHKPNTVGGVAFDAAKPSTFDFPPGFAIPYEAFPDDVREIASGIYNVPGLKETPVTVLDIGAHVGLFSYWASRNFAGAWITAYEPVGYNYEMLLKNTRGISGLKAYQSAVSNHNCELILNKGRNSLCHSVRTEGTIGEQFSVPCSDASLIGRFDFVKVDTEGSELPILSALDLSATKAVVCEAHSSEDATAISSLLESRGFKKAGETPTLHKCRVLKFARPEALKEVLV